MNKKVSSIQMGMLLYLITAGYFLGMSDIILIRMSGGEILISMMIGSLIGLIPIFMYLKVNSTYTNLNIYEKVIKLFGKKLGTFINILIAVAYLIIFCISIRTVISFTITKYLENTPYIIVGLLVVISCLIAVFKGLESILRLARISFIITIIFAFMIEISMTGFIDVDNLLPMFATNNYLKNIIDGSLFFATTTSFLSILLLTIKKNSIKDKNSYNKIAIAFYLLSCFSLTLVMFFIVGCYGYKLSSLFRYPEYVALKKLGFSSSELHLENLLAFRWVFYSLALACTSLYGIETGIKTYSKKIGLNKLILISIAILSVCVSKCSLGTVPHAIIIMKKYYFSMLTIPIFTLLLIIFIRCLFIKNN